jgi:hypothetical protein
MSESTTRSMYRIPELWVFYLKQDNEWADAYGAEYNNRAKSYTAERHEPYNFELKHELIPKANILGNTYTREFYTTKLLMK